LAKTIRPTNQIDNKKETLMKLVIFGATGKTGLELVKQSLDKGHLVTAFVRSPERMPVEHDRLTIAVGDVFDPAGVEQALKGQDAVICALGAGSDLKKTTVRTTGTTNIINGMHSSGVKRLFVVTAMGVGESWDTLSFFNKLFFATLLKSSRDDHEAQEAAVKDSRLDWTIIRPSGLTDEPKTGVYLAGEKILAKTSRIPRADVADLILKELERPDNIHKALTITN
jgi:putative NADH-flavin reductase